MILEKQSEELNTRIVMEENNYSFESNRNFDAKVT